MNSFFTYEDSLENIKEAAAAELNIVVSDVYGTEAAAVFKALHGVPYITAPLPIGPAATGDFLRQVGKALSIDTGQLEKFIAGEEDYYYQTLDPLVECYSDLDLQRYAVVVGDANYAPAVTRFLAEDLGWLPGTYRLHGPAY